MELTEILKTLPHRYPLLLVDRVLEVEAKKRIVAIKNVTFNEAFFQGHFPGKPVMPGVLVLEAMAQAGAILLLHDMPDRENKVVLFGGIDRARFRRPVVPGDRLVLKVECLRHRSRSSKMRGVAEVDGERVAEAEVLCAYGDRETI